MLLRKYHNRQYRLDETIGARLWEGETFANEAQVEAMIKRAILDHSPLLAGKLGTNEQRLVQWHMRTPIPAPWGGQTQVHYWQTRSCAYQAGVWPRSRKSYHELGARFVDLLPQVDVLSVFRLAGEHTLWRRFAPQALPTWHGAIEPFHTAEPWSSALAGKRVLVISPFATTIADQYARKDRGLIWPGKRVLPDFDLITCRFPYLIDPRTSLTWQEVYSTCVDAIHASDADVVIAGCGALGLPLCQAAKQAGKVGVHLGGTLQIMFGIIGKRFETSHLKSLINKHWVRPHPSETPRDEVKRAVEEGCYW